MLESDTIAAIATPAGQGAIAMLRLSGPAALEVASKVVSTLSDPRRSPRKVIRSTARDNAGAVLDEVLITYFRSPASFTGEDTIEISCHGGVLVTRKILDALLTAGARLAHPGEFSQRAFLNGKLDLTQAEAIMDVISAQTSLALRAAQEQLGGRLGAETLAIRGELLGILAHVEAYIDFPEEDIDPVTGSALRDQMAAAHSRILRLLSTAEQGRILREGVRTVLCGAPNAGKSSLLNVLLGFERAIVSETPGTTRDTIEEVINLRGLPLRLIDTAGLRPTTDSVESAGISRTNVMLRQADLILEIVDASDPAAQRPAIPPEATAHRLLVLNKVDLGMSGIWQESTGLPISCKTGEGIEALGEAIFAQLTSSAASFGGDLIAINSRHQSCLHRSAEFLTAAMDSLSRGLSAEFVSIDLRASLDCIGEVTGRLDTEELLGEIFSRFCIGK